jgi:hypothetical protein
MESKRSVATSKKPVSSKQEDDYEDNFEKDEDEDDYEVP